MGAAGGGVPLPQFVRSNRNLARQRKFRFTARRADARSQGLRRDRAIRVRDDPDGPLADRRIPEVLPQREPLGEHFRGVGVAHQEHVDADARRRSRGPPAPRRSPPRPSPGRAEPPGRTPGCPRARSRPPAAPRSAPARPRAPPAPSTGRSLRGDTTKMLSGAASRSRTASVRPRARSPRVPSPVRFTKSGTSSTGRSTAAGRRSALGLPRSASVASPAASPTMATTATKPLRILPPNGPATIITAT